MSSLRIKTHELLINRDKTLSLIQISKDADVSLDWLRSFHSKGKTMRSYVDSVQRLYEYLTGKKLVV